MGIKKLGFTLIEIILVIAVIGVALPALINIVFTIVRQQYRIVALQEIKSQGDNVLNSMQTTIRNSAIGIYRENTLVNAECTDSLLKSQYGPNDGVAFFFKDKEGKYFHFYLNSVTVDNSYIASQSAVSTIHLTNARVRITDFLISCKRSAAYSSPVIAINFTVSHQEGSHLDYSTRVKLRN